jgi:hypothetical protein
MRYLLLSVLVVCVIGVMIPSAFGQIGPNYDPLFYDVILNFFMLYVGWIVLACAFSAVILVVIAIKMR